MKNRIFLLQCLILVLCCTSACKDQSTYNVTRILEPATINANWNKEPWKNIPSLSVDNYMGDLPDHKPKVQTKVVYDEEAIYVIFHVEDQYVKCLMNHYQDPVSKDSAVEFFFTPGNDISKGYFNLEVNCGGTGLFKFQKMPRKNQIKIPKATFDKIEIAHSLPTIVDPEIMDPVTWTIEYRIPFNILTEYYGKIDYPAPGVEWKANFYKIADNSSHPHWLTWSHVDNPTPQFHLPEYFGTLKFK